MRHVINLTIIIILLASSIIAQKLWHQPTYLPAARAMWCSEVPVGGVHIHTDTLKMYKDAVSRAGCKADSMALTEEWHIVWAVQVIQSEGE